MPLSRVHGDASRGSCTPEGSRNCLVRLTETFVEYSRTGRGPPSFLLRDAWIRQGLLMLSFTLGNLLMLNYIHNYIYWCIGRRKHTQRPIFIHNYVHYTYIHVYLHLICKCTCSLVEAYLITILGFRYCHNLVLWTRFQRVLSLLTPEAGSYNL